MAPLHSLILIYHGSQTNVSFPMDVLDKNPLLYVWEIVLFNLNEEEILILTTFSVFFNFYLFLIKRNFKIQFNRKKWSFDKAFQPMDISGVDCYKRSKI